MRWPALSIRSTALLAIVAGVVAPAILVVFVAQALERGEREHEVRANRSALMALGAAVMADPAWTVSDARLRQAMAQLLDNPTVCAVEVLGLPGTNAARPYLASECPPDIRTTDLETPVLHDDKSVATLRMRFDDTAVDREIADTLWMTVWMVAAQVVLGVLVLAGVLAFRFLRPIDKLRAQAGRLAAREPSPRVGWPRQDEVGQLGEHLNDVRDQIQNLIGELEQKNEQLHQMAMYDHLTGLPNRTLLRELFAREAAAARRDGSMLAMIFLDLDQFKTVNDSHGHAVGDELLVRVGECMLAALRESDVVCRMGGDEFLVMLPRIDTWDRVAGTAERLLHAIQTPHQLGSACEPQRVGASIGVAMYPADGADFDALVRAADLAMYRSKDLGRARYSFYHTDLDKSFRARIETERELAEAIEKGELLLHYQPVVDARSGRTSGCEALVRWMHPRRGLLAPGAFIQVAEDAGLIKPIGRWVMASACAQLAKWKAAGAPTLKMAVNVSALQLRDADFPDFVRRTLRLHGIEAGELSLELTESTLLADGDGALATVDKLRETGADLALDDFGTGYSSLSYLKRLRPDTLKIDRSFVRDLPDDAGDCALALAILGMAQALSITVLAEGVENAAQRDWLTAQGCALQQGYLWAKPLPPAEFEQRLAITSA